MTAKEMNLMVEEINKQGVIVPNRNILESYPYELSRGLCAIGRTDLANRLDDLYNEMEMVDSAELARLGTFNRKDG